jgi:ABC-type lipoprotein release transport system permease subunit
MNDPEDRQIRAIFITFGAGAVAVFLLAATTLAVMISYNFNFLNWME